MRKFFIKLAFFLLFIAFAVAATAAALFYFQNRSTTAELTAKSNEITQLTLENQSLQEQFAGEEEAPAKECYAQSEDGWIVVNHPCDGEKLEKVFQLNGVAFGLFENNLEYAIVDSDGNELQSGFLTVKAPDLGVPGTFDKVLSWDGKATGNGKFIAFSSSAADGSRLHLVEIPVVFE